MAAFLLGLPSSGTIDNPINYSLHSIHHGVFSRRLARNDAMRAPLLLAQKAEVESEKDSETNRADSDGGKENKDYGDNF